MSTATLFETQTPQPAKTKVGIETVGDELHLTWRGGGIGAALFLMLWLSGWSAGCGMMLYQLATDFEWFLLLFSIPFFSAWFAVAGILAYLLFGRQHLVVSRESLRIYYQVFVPFFSRTVPLEEVDRAMADEVFEENNRGRGRFVGVVRIETIGKPVEFARGIDETEREWLAEVINVCLDRLAPHRAARTEDPEETQGVEDGPLDLEADLVDYEEELLEETFELPDQPVLRPSDSNFEIQREGRALGFVARGKWSLKAIASLTFIMLFWNGIVSVFVMELIGNFQWFLFFFLIPFEVIGLGMIAGWLAAVAAPLFGQRYTFRLGQIEQIGWIALFRRRKTIVFEELAQVVIAPADPKVGTFSVSVEGEDSAKDYCLRLVDPQGTTVTEIDGLMRGEARWMADTLLRERPEMFRR